MKISRVKAVNFKGIKNIDVLLRKGVNKITGANGAGKSSLKDSIMATLCGAKYTPDVPIRLGQGKAEVTVETDDFIAHGIYTKAGRRIEISSVDGLPIRKPQEFLDKCIGPLTFDPVAFYLAKPPVQVAMLKELVQVDFMDLNKRQFEIKNKRSDAKREKERLQHEAERVQVVDGLPDEEVSVAELVEELRNADEQNDSISSSNNVFERKCESIRNLATEIEQLKDRLVECEQKKAMIKKTTQSYELKKLIDITPIQQRIADSEKINADIRERNRRERLEEAAEEQSRIFSELGQQAKSVESERADRLAKCEMPVEGLSLTDEYVTFGELPLKQVNTGKQLQICVSIAMAMNQGLKTVFVKANDLDVENIKILEDMIIKKDYQALIELADSSGTVGIVIQDGRIKEKE